MPHDASGGFPDGFLWGAATAAYQVEGHPLADGAGPSIWHRFSHTPGLVRGGDTGDLACEHYLRCADDVRLMAELGLQAYRFSIAWPRVLPEGRGSVNDTGLDFYRRLVDMLLERSIRPMATLYHWDLPAALDDRGGWLNPDSAGWFADYAEVLFRALGDRVELWATLNEPWVVVDGGYLHGTLAPGHRVLAEAPLAARNLLRAHAAALAAGRAAGARRIGLVVNLTPHHAASGRPVDRAAAARCEAYVNHQFLDPVLLGRHPDEMAELFGDAWAPLSPADMERVRAPIDFVGVNYYLRRVVRDDPGGLPPRAAYVVQPGMPHTAMGWEVYPRGLTETLLWVRGRYGEIPLYVTENGAAFPDPERAGGPLVEDPLRVAYLHEHLRAALDAIRHGVDLRGYFVWSLLDNLEWAEGFSKRFGIVHVDFATRDRTPKASARFYAEVVLTHGRCLLTG
ncbi:MAG: beta-glucosidase [Acidobacteria bacterium]|nr:beta-glucosidase [Acidobacteriota bacterium]